MHTRRNFNKVHVSTFNVDNIFRVLLPSQGIINGVFSINVTKEYISRYSHAFGKLNLTKEGHFLLIFIFKA